MTVRSSRRRHRALLSAARHLNTLHLHCYLRYIFPAALRCGIDCKRFAISITTDATWRRRRRRRLLFAFGLAAIDLSTEVDLCNRYKGICRSAIPDLCRYCSSTAIRIAISGGFVRSDLRVNGGWPRLSRFVSDQRACC